MPMNKNMPTSMYCTWQNSGCVQKLKNDAFVCLSESKVIAWSGSEATSQYAASIPINIFIKHCLPKKDARKENENRGIEGKLFWILEYSWSFKSHLMLFGYLRNVWEILIKQDSLLKYVRCLFKLRR